MSTLEQIQHRCTRCFRTLSADIHQVGTEQPCEFCGQLLVVPDPESLAEQFSSYISRKPAREQAYGSEAAMTSLASFSLGNTNPLAPLWKRFVGSLVDNVLLGLAFVAGVFLAILLMQQGLLDRHAVMSKVWNIDKINAQAAIYFPVAILLIFQWNLIASRGQSIGKFLLRMKIVDPHGGNPGFICGVVLRNWLRALLSLLPLFAFLDWVVIFGESRRCIHDYLAGTTVVDSE